MNSKPINIKEDTAGMNTRSGFRVVSPEEFRRILKEQPTLKDFWFPRGFPPIKKEKGQ